MGKGWALMAAALAALVVASTPADAASRTCRNLEARLAAASSGGGAVSPEARKWRDAAARQRSEIAKAKSRCGGGFSSFFGGGDADPSCKGQIARMQRNLAQLERKASQLSGGRKESRAAILAALEQNGCRDEGRQQVAELGKKNRSIIEQLFGGSERRPLDENANRRTIVTTLKPRDGNSVTIDGLGTYRTMCVRTCDGYFFPMSFSTRKDMFERDQQACESACPGTEVKLYAHQVPEQESEDMVSVKGEPYSALPTAWNFQQAGFVRPAACACGAPKLYEVIAGDTTVKATMPKGDDAPMPTARPESTTETTATTPAAPVERDIASADRKVRVVGPEFLPDPEEAIDLRAPGRKPAPSGPS